MLPETKDISERGKSIKARCIENKVYFLQWNGISWSFNWQQIKIEPPVFTSVPQVNLTLFVE